MDGSSLIVIDMPIMILIALFTGRALPFITGSRTGAATWGGGRHAQMGERIRATGGRPGARHPARQHAAPVE